MSRRRYTGSMPPHNTGPDSVPEAPAPRILRLASDFALRADVLDGRSYRFDEGFRWKMLTFPWREMIAQGARDNHGPLCFIVAKVWAVHARERTDRAGVPGRGRPRRFPEIYEDGCEIFVRAFRTPPGGSAVLRDHPCGSPLASDRPFDRVASSTSVLLTTPSPLTSVLSGVRAETGIPVVAAIWASD